MSTIEELCAEAGRHRGLWIGMFPDPSEDLERVWYNFVELNSASLMASEIKSLRELHVTIFHLGKNNSSSVVERVATAVEMTSSAMTGGRRVGVEGYLRLPHHAALAIVPDEIVRIRNILAMGLRDRGVKPDDRFAGLPHMTIGKIARTVQRPNDSDASVVCPGVRPFAANFGGLTVVCGDASLTVPFGNGVF